MCGIHFAINNGTNVKGLDGFLRDAFYANQVRGTDASGMFQVKNTMGTGGKVRDVRYVKDSVDGSTFLYDPGAKELLTAAPSQLATVCHVRAATAGAVTKENSHPFMATRRDGSRIIGVHNGSLRNWKSKVGSELFSVDSAWLYHKIATDGIDAFDSIDGAFALVWYDSADPDTMYIARNKERPLAWGVTKDGKTMIGASEVGMLGWLAARNSLEMKKLVEDYTYVYPEEGYLYKINMKDLTKYEKIKLPEYKASNTRYDRPPAPVTRYPTRATSSFNWNDFDEDGYSPAPRQQPASTNSSDVDWFIQRQSSILNAVKLALRGPAVPVELKKEDEVVTELDDDAVAALSTALDELSEEEQVQIKELLEGPADKATHFSSLANESVDGEADGAVRKEKFEYMHNPPKGNVSISEEQMAKALGIWGLCVNFVGYMYDKETSLTYGDFRTIEDGKTQVYDSIVRGNTEKYANDQYINPSKFSKMVVVGLSKNMSKDATPFLILAERSQARPQNIYNHPYRVESPPSNRMH